MNESELQRLIARGETLAVEFKGERHHALSDTELVEAAVCLANRVSREPAILLVGVEDDGQISGVRAPVHSGSRDPRHVQAMIANRTRPSLSVAVEAVEIGGKTVMAITIPWSQSPVGTADGKYLRRGLGGDGKPACLPMHFTEMQSLLSSRGNLDHSSAAVAGATWEDLDPLELERYRRVIRESQRGDGALLELPNEELARVLSAIDGDGVVRVAGLLLFGREDTLRTHIPTHEVAFQVLRGSDVVVNEFFRWPLIRIMEELVSRFRARNQETELPLGMLRIGVPDYPERAFREALANALIHRDLTRMGAVHVQWHPDRIEISNPGGFPDGVGLHNLLVTPPRPRNPLLADAFARAGLVERTGRGIDTIFLEQLRNGRPAPSYDRSSETDVVLVLPGGTANLDFVRLVAEESRANKVLGLDDLLVLNRLWLDREVDTHAVTMLIQKSETEARAVLQRLVEYGLLEPRGEKKGRVYHLSASTYRRFGEKAEYVRQRGFEPQQQEQMVLQYVKTHGRITRSEASDLCRIGPRQAGRMLSKLVREGRLNRRGERRWASYDLP
ncbi:MAG: AAA family ATPase [Dehalococcoidia bacterium]|nr:AAA family ATPase [Dehalococcoidia bacterium]